MKLVATISLALGVATIAAGGMAFAFGMSTTDIVTVVGLGPLNGLWEPPDYCFLGTILAAVGVGITTFSLVWVALLFRHGQAVLPRRRWLVWSLVLALGVAGVGTGATVQFSQRSPRITQADAETARSRVLDLLMPVGGEPDIPALTTAEYRQRDGTAKQSVRYKLVRCQTTTTTIHASGQITVTARATASGKTTTLRLDNGVLVGGGAVLMSFPTPKEVVFTARLVRGDNGLWLIDELVAEEG